MNVNSWLIDGPTHRIEIVQVDLARLDAVSFGWRQGNGPIYSDAPRILRRLSHRAVPELLVPGAHFAMVANWVDDPTHELDEAGQAVLQFVDSLEEDVLLEICRRDARHRLRADESLTFEGLSVHESHLRDVAQARLEVTALSIEEPDVRRAALDLLCGGWHHSCEQLVSTAYDVLGRSRIGRRS